MFNPFAKNAEGVKTAQQLAAASTQQHLKIAEIRDGTLVLKNGGIRAILRCSSVNFNLKSEQEQNAIIYSYQAFLNTLEFPIQIVVRSRKLDLDAYIVKLKKIAEKQSNTLLQKQTYDYADYIQRLIEYADIMEKEFFVVVPMNPPRAQDKSFLSKFWDRMHPADSVTSILQRHREFEQLKKTLLQRVNATSSGLENCGLKVNALGTEELISLFYQIYNPLTSRRQKTDGKLDTLKFSTDQSMGRP